MARRQILVALGLPAVLAVAIGLAAGIWETPSHLYGEGGPLASAHVVLPTVLVAGLVDGINPCAFTVLLLFVAAMVSMYGSAGNANNAVLRGKLALHGGVFIFAIFAIYLALGVGLLHTSAILSQNHVGARLGALASVALGLWMVKDALVPGWGPPLRAPASIGRLVSDWGRRATFPLMTGLGILVGLCTVPCSGAVYVAVISMLALQQNFARAYTYLVVYNIMFILPLLLLLGAASARPTLNRLARWNLHHKERVRLGLGGAVLVLGMAILATV